LAKLPGVAAASAANTLPFYNRSGGPLVVEGWDSLPGRVYRHLIDGDYFASLGLSVIRGRPIGAQDRAGAEPAAVVNEHLARTLFPQGAIGRCLYVESETRCSRVVGVVENASLGGIRSEPMMQFYITAAQHPEVSELEVLILRLAPEADAAAVISAARGLISRIEPMARYVEVSAVRDELEYELRAWRLGAVLFSVFGTLALALAVFGLYALISFDVSQQMRELGLRSALGASAMRLLFAVMRRAVIVAMLGVVGGIVVAWLLAPRVSDLVFAVAPRDPLSLASVAALLLATACLATLIPAARAARVDPASLLRTD
jgi:hypothetical protein